MIISGDFKHDTVRNRISRGCALRRVTGGGKVADNNAPRPRESDQGAWQTPDRCPYRMSTIFADWVNLLFGSMTLVAWKR